MAHLPYEFTATFTNGSANVTAVTAAFVTNLTPGDVVRGIDEKIYGVATVGPLQTQFTLDRPYLGPTTTAAAKAFRHSEQWGMAADANVRLARTEEALLLGFLMQSASSLVIGTGAKAFTGVASGLPVGNGIRMRAASRANTANWMEGICAYSGSTLTMTVVAGDTGGSGTFADWNINIAGAKGAVGGAAPILGTVSQSGGVPTGAIFETGSNANGNYVRYADGTQICDFEVAAALTTSTGPTAGGLYRTALTSRPFPAAFLAGTIPKVAPTGRYGGAGNFSWVSCSTASATACTPLALSDVNTSTVFVGYIAIGRWF